MELLRKPIASLTGRGGSELGRSAGGQQVAGGCASCANGEKLLRFCGGRFSGRGDNGGRERRRDRSCERAEEGRKEARKKAAGGGDPRDWVVVWWCCGAAAAVLEVAAGGGDERGAADANANGHGSYTAALQQTTEDPGEAGFTELMRPQSSLEPPQRPKLSPVARPAPYHKAFTAAAAPLPTVTISPLKRLITKAWRFALLPALPARPAVPRPFRSPDTTIPGGVPGAAIGLAVIRGQPLGGLLIGAAPSAAACGGGWPGPVSITAVRRRRRTTKPKRRLRCRFAISQLSCRYVVASRLYHPAALIYHGGEYSGKNTE
ncbi:hypothetical protein DFH27DRAFT_607325 [Peziza echinospora]|nr:hypothetical protein DFH27DRAFT_607325 [Peziza echinospora]